MSDAISDFAAAMSKAGLTPPGPIIADGRLHRFKPSEDRRGGKHAWYVLFADEHPAGSFGTWKGDKITWKADGQRMSDAERRAFADRIRESRAERKAIEEAAQARAAEYARKLWAGAGPAPDDHDYLARKGIGAHGLRLDDRERLIVPMRDVDGVIWSAQTIAPAGGKLFIEGGRVQGLFYMLGEPGERLVIAEGFSTAASIHEATGLPVAAAFNCGNLPHVAKAIRARHPQADIIIASDDDSGTKENAGPKKAREAALAVGGTMAMPSFAEGSGGSDFNDMARDLGLEAVREAIEGAETARIQAVSQPDADERPTVASILDFKSPIERDKAIKRLAKAEGVSVEAVRAEVRELERAGWSDGQEGEAGDAGGRTIDLREPEPWPDPVDGEALLDELAGIFEEHLSLPSHAATKLSLWSVHAHGYTASPVSPRLAIVSPEKGCGKTTTLNLVGALVPKPIQASNVTSAALFRTIERYRPTLLIDEADTFLPENEELRGVLNSGHLQTGAVIRVVAVGEDWEPRQFSTWAPMAIAAIGKLPGTLEDRSLVVSMRRALPGEVKRRLRIDRLGEFWPAARRIARWVADHHDELASAEPEMPDAVANRQADNWRPMLAIAGAAGKRWASKARAAMLAEVEASSDTSLGVMLLEDIKAAFVAAAADWLGSQRICDELVKKEDRPWGEISKGRPITTHKLGRILSTFGIGPHSDGALRGYKLAAFGDAFKRYLRQPTPSQGVSERQNVTSPSSSRGSNGFQSVSKAVATDTLKSQSSPTVSTSSDALTIQSPQSGGAAWEMEI